MELLTDREVATVLRVSRALLRKWRVTRRGPKFVKLGTLVRYREADLEAFVAQQERDPQGPGGEQPA